MAAPPASDCNLDVFQASQASKSGRIGPFASCTPDLPEFSDFHGAKSNTRQIKASHEVHQALQPQFGMVREQPFKHPAGYHRANFRKQNRLCRRMKLLLAMPLLLIASCYYKKTRKNALYLTYQNTLDSAVQTKNRFPCVLRDHQMFGGSDAAIVTTSKALVTTSEALVPSSFLLLAMASNLAIASIQHRRQSQNRPPLLTLQPPAFRMRRAILCHEDAL